MHQSYQKRSISIHALREEGDSSASQLIYQQRYFYPRPPRGGRPKEIDVEYREVAISIHALREEGDRQADRRFPGLCISIHALREEGDDVYAGGQCDHPNFYPRPPRGGRPHSSTVRLSGGAFLSTPSARRATALALDGREILHISIHALREEGDSVHRCSISGHIYFYPRPPRGGRRRTGQQVFRAW